MERELERYLADRGPTGLFTRLARATLLVEGFQHRCLDPFGLRFIDFSVLRVLDLAGEPHELSAGELADLTLRSTGGITQIVDRLAAAGLVVRRPDPSDRRRVVVGLTDAGLDLVRRAQQAYARERARVLAPLDDAELARLDDAVGRLIDVLEGDAAVEVAS
ncbi:MarR family winged helix-turn-helix transcriptional regulator [Rhabdothermincola salaria]|uniref:MarR family winged helix-turn-helix transcriptional regulator n=1 Tax=Rhabdothermincola salaria TaxID=2903142 RepID=UPI001E2DAB8C|nr:MarR family transcriptional regulator [Rhabdothermincola salaria]